MDNDDYYGLGYQDNVDEMNRLEGEINNKILEIKNIGKNGRTISIEKEVSDLLQKYSENYQSLEWLIYHLKFLQKCHLQQLIKEN